MEIKQNYLMWIGKEHYAKITDWTSEALAQGISKRVSNAATAKALTEEGTVVFVAHDEGEYKECHGCLGVIENPERRKAEQEIARLDKEVQSLQDEGARLASSHGLGEREMEALAAKGEHPAISDENDKKLKAVDRKIINRVKKANELRKAVGEMDRWIDGGTGGHVQIVTPGLGTKKWDYRRYNYWLHQPNRFNTEDVLEKEMCETCGGTGRLPEGKVFGMFVPQDFEYIVPEGAEQEIVEKMKAEGASLVSEADIKLESKRGCGKRKAGGVYVVTSTSGSPVNTKAAVAQLVEEGKLEAEGAEITGQFAHFVTPVPIEAKRFRGIKRWGLDPAVEDEAEMISEAI